MCFDVSLNLIVLAKINRRASIPRKSYILVTASLKPSPKSFSNGVPFVKLKAKSLDICPTSWVTQQLLARVQEHQLAIPSATQVTSQVVRDSLVRTSVPMA